MWKDPSKNSNMPDDSNAEDESARSPRGRSVKPQGVESSRSDSPPVVPVVVTVEPVGHTTAPSAAVRAPPSSSLSPPPPSSALRAALGWFESVPHDTKLRGLCGALLALTYAMNWMSLFFLVAILTALLIFRTGQDATNNELRFLKKKLLEMERRLSETSAASSTDTGAPVAQQRVIIEPDRDVAKLLVQHRAELEDTRRSLADEIDPKIHDDIFLLRFVLVILLVLLSVCAFVAALNIRRGCSRSRSPRWPWRLFASVSRGVARTLRCCSWSIVASKCPAEPLSTSTPSVTIIPR